MGHEEFLFGMASPVHGDGGGLGELSFLDLSPEVTANDLLYAENVLADEILHPGTYNNQITTFDFDVDEVMPSDDNVSLLEDTLPFEVAHQSRSPTLYTPCISDYASSPSHSDYGSSIGSGHILPKTKKIGERKRLQNREAAKRYRDNKKFEQKQKATEKKLLERQNGDLRYKMELLLKQISTLEADLRMQYSLNPDCQFVVLNE